MRYLIKNSKRIVFQIMNIGGNNMVNIDDYMHRLQLVLQQVFENRLLYLGLQGSYRRGEETPTSDIDAMVILDYFTIQDMDLYRKTVTNLTPEEQTCGFICGKQELLHWNPGEICQLIHETKDYYGNLKDFVPEYTLQDVKNHIKVNVGNLYHGLCHEFIHSSQGIEKEQLQFAYKSIFYLLQNLHFIRTGKFILKKQDLDSYLEGVDLQVLQTAESVKTKEFNGQHAFQLLFGWCQQVLHTIDC